MPAAHAGIRLSARPLLSAVSGSTSLQTRKANEDKNSCMKILRTTETTLCRRHRLASVSIRLRETLSDHFNSVNRGPHTIQPQTTTGTTHFVTHHQETKRHLGLEEPEEPETKPGEQALSKMASASN